MSRRLRFQVKPNLSLSSATPAPEEPKPAAAAANPPISEPKQAETAAPAIVDEPSTIRSPSPRPPPLPVTPSIVENADTSIVDSEMPSEDVERTTTTDLEPMQVESATADVPTTSSSESHLIQQLTAPVSMPPPPLPQSLPVQPSANKPFDARAKRLALKGKKLDRSSFLMRDLIFWSPEEDDEGAEDGDDLASVSSKSSGVRRRGKRKYAPSFETPQPIVAAEKKAAEEKTTAPQVKVNPDGTITIDEASLVVDRREQAAGTDFETVDETWGYGVGPARRGPRLTSMSFRRNKLPGRGRRWSKFETDKFYRVLSFAGLDFTLMAELFSTRSRLELKRKYKRESIDDPLRVDQALRSDSGRHGPWKDLKTMIIDRGRITNDEKSRALLDTAREFIEEEDEKIELATGLQKPSIAVATKIANRISKRGFGDSGEISSEDDVSPEQLEEMATAMIEELEKKKKAAAARKKKAEEMQKKREEYHVSTRTLVRKKMEEVETDQAALRPSSPVSSSCGSSSTAY